LPNESFAADPGKQTLQRAEFVPCPQTMGRYLAKKLTARCRPWREDCLAANVLAGQTLRLDPPDESIVATCATTGRPRPTSRRATRALACM
jgi:hypothetical protein